MKKSLRQIAAAAASGQPLNPIDQGTALRWFTGSHGYFPDPAATEQAIAALRDIPQEQKLPDSATPAIIAIEGLDGSGKTLQANTLRDALAESGKRVYLVDFPQYDSFFGREIGQLLSGQGQVSAMDLDERSMCLWYAMDRWQTLSQVDLDDYDYVIFNRYTMANVVYQSARKYGRFDRELAGWIFQLEHVVLDLPVPDQYLYLDTQVSFTGENVLKKGQRGYTSGLDVYESSSSLLGKCHAIYRELSREIPSISTIECIAPDGSMKSVKSISKLLMDRLVELELVDI